MKLHVLPLLALSAIYFNPGYANQEELNLESITVTGTRSSVMLSEMSGNLTRLSTENISLTQSTHFTELMNQVAGVWVSRGNGQEHLTAIRSPVLTGAGSCGAFFVAEDGISVRAAGFCNANQLFDVNANQAGAITVLRGPASVIYGSNAVHGVLNTLTPDAESIPDISISLEAGPNDFQRVSLTSAKTTGDHAVAVYGALADDGGYKENSGYRQDKFNLLHQTQSAQLKVKNVLSYSNLNQETAGFVQGFEAFKQVQLKRLNPNPEAYRNSRSVRGHSQIEFTRGNYNILLKPYFRSHDMAFLQHFLPWQATEENGHDSIGLLSAATIQHDFVTLTLGMDLDYTEGWLKEFQEQEFSDSIPQGEHYDYQVDALVISPYINSQWQITDAFSVDAGLRYDRTRYDYKNNLEAGSACAPGIDNCRFYRPEDQARSFSNISAKLGATYSLSADQVFYGQINRGFRAPQATELFRLQNNQVNADLNAEKMTALETGVRGRLFEDNRLFYDLSAYMMRKSDHIFQDTERQNVSEGKTSHKGLELTLSWRITPNWKLNLALDKSRHQYENNVAIARGVNIKNNDIDTAPQNNAQINLQWQKDQFSAQLEWLYLDDYYLDPANTAKYDGHQLVNLRARVPVNDKLTFSFRVMNLLDEDYAERADFAFGNYRYFVGEPRSLFLHLNYKP